MVEVNEATWKKLLAEIPLAWRHYTDNIMTLYIHTGTELLKVGRIVDNKYFMLKDLAEAYGVES